MWRRTNVLVILAVAVAALYLLDVGCPIRWLTGVPCPGCGLTRAYVAALHLDFAGAFALHPLWPVAGPLVAYLLVGKPPLFGGARLGRVVPLGFVALLLAVYVARLCVPHDPVVSIDLHSGAVERVLESLLQGISAL
jgi:hypothetical protein